MNIGDVVYLKGGGIPFTVVDTLPDGIRVEVAWFNGMVQRAILPISSVIDVDPSTTIDHARAKASAQLYIDDPLPVKPIS